MKTQLQKLPLHRESLRRLTPQELTRAAAGAPLATWACYTTERVFGCTTWSQDVCSIANG